MFQAFKGRVTLDWINPWPVDAIVGEWHDACFVKGYPDLFRPQSGPYVCTCCESELAHGAEVIFCVLGNKPGGEYVWTERRGKELQFVVERECWGRDPFAPLYRRQRYMLL